MRVARAELARSVPAPVRAVVDRITDGGGNAWLVGGTVRDLLLGLRPRDYDVATDLRPERLAGLFDDADLADAKYGAVRVPSPLGAIGLTTLRAESGYRDHRRPDRVEFVTDLATDAVRRDFTVNALFYDCAAGEIVDPVAGLADLDARVLRAIGAPARRFDEDHLRLLRAVKFAARCDLSIEPATAAAASGAAGGLATLSPERAFAELTDAFVGPGRGAALLLLVELGFAAVLLPEVAAMAGVTQPPDYHPEGCVLTHTALVLDNVPSDDPVLSWSAVLHDIGKPPTWRQADDRIRFDGHDVLSARMAEAVLRRFHVRNDIVEPVVEICRDHIRFASLPDMRPRRRERWLRSPLFPLHLAFHRADCLGSHGDLRIHDFAARELADLPPEKAPLVRGRDVLALGIAPGPAVGRVLAAVEAAADEAPMALDREAALVLLRDTVDRLRQAGDL